MKLSDSVYDVFKWLSILFFPALAELFNTVLPVWNVDPALINALVITANGFGLFIGICIGVSHITIKKEEAEKAEAQEEFYETETEDDLELDLPSSEESSIGGEES